MDVVDACLPAIGKHADKRQSALVNNRPRIVDALMLHEVGPIGVIKGP